MEFDVWLVAVRGDLDKLSPDAHVSVGGFRKGPIALEPLDDFEERCRKRWPGRHRLLLRTKWRENGRMAHTGVLAIDTLDASSSAAAAPGGTDAALLAHIEKLTAQVLELSRRSSTPATPAPALGEQVGALGQIASIFAQVQGGKTDAGGALTPELVNLLVGLGAKTAGTGGLAEKALEMLGPKVGNILEVSSALLLTKINERDDRKTAAANARRRAEFEAQKKAEEAQKKADENKP